MIAEWPLTRREAEVADMLCRGLTRREIIAALGVSHKTYDTHRLNMKRKLGVRNEIQLLRYALEHGLVEPIALNPGASP